MTEHERQKRLAELLAEENAAPQQWYYCSFASDKGFLGVCWVRAGGAISAAQIAQLHGCNPGGELMAVPLPFRCDPPAGSANKLHTDRAAIDALMAQWDEGHTS